MAELDLRVRLPGRMSITTMDDERLARMQQQSPGHNPVLDAVFGGVAQGVTLTDSTAAGAAGPVPVRTYRPAGPSADRLPLVVSFHGGGWALGSLDGADWLCSSVAAEVRAVVVSVAYRLAPAHRWPAAAEDCYAALVDVVARAADLGADPARVAVMGDSAGGDLAAVVSLMARDRSGPALAHQALLYPTDLTLSSPSIEQHAHAPVLTAAACRALRDHYLGGQEPRQPYASPLRDAGVAARTTTYVGMPHGYLSLPRLCCSAPQALHELCTQLGEALVLAAAPA